MPTTKKETNSLLKMVEGEKGNSALSTWTDERRKDFCQLLARRTEFAQVALATTAQAFFTEAKDRFFVPQKTDFPNFPVNGITLELEWRGKSCRTVRARTGGYREPDSVGGRTLMELAEVCADRVAELINTLPNSLAVVKIIKPGTAKKMSALEVSESELAEVHQELEEISQEINFDDFAGEHPNMTLIEFRKHVDELNRRKRQLAKDTDKLSVRVARLRREVNTELHKGIPKLEKATMDVIETMRQECLALGQMDRRVGEKVMFGDSDACMEILQKYERDEVKLVPEAAKHLKAALAKIQAIKGIKAGRSRVRRKK